MTLSDLVCELAQRHRIPGIAAAVVHGDQTLTACSGVTSTADPLEITPETLFLIGSTTKTITGTAIMALVEQDRLDLDCPVIDLVPDFRTADPEVAPQVRLRQLLNHSAGWRGDDQPMPGWGDDALAQVTELVGQATQEASLGTQMSYNNTAVMLAGRIVELATGQSYEDAVTELVLRPLGMTETFFHPWDVANRRLAVGHLVTAEAQVPIQGWPLVRMLAPTGGAICSLTDQVRYLRWHLAGGPGPLSDESRLAMQAQTMSCRSGSSGVGLPWLLDSYAAPTPVPLVTHGGNVSNLHTSAFAFAPSLGLGVTVTTNSKHGRDCGRAILEWAMGELAGIPAEVPLPTASVRPERAREYAGRYDLGAWQLLLEFDGSTLTLRRELPESLDPAMHALFDAPPLELRALSGEADIVVTTAEPAARAADFGRDAAGQVAWIRYGNRITRKLRA